MTDEEKQGKKEQLVSSKASTSKDYKQDLTIKLKPGKISKDKKVAVFSLVFTVLFGLFSIISFFWPARNSILYLDILYNDPLVDIKESVAELSIKYQGKDLLESKEILRRIIMRIRYEGKQPITKELFVEEDPLRIEIKNGSLLTVPIVTKASNDYLKNYTRIETYQPDKIEFNPFIIEADEYVELNFLCLTPKAKIPKFELKGKVTTVKEMRVVEVNQSHPQSDYLYAWFAINSTVSMGAFILAIIIIIVGSFRGVREIWPQMFYAVIIALTIIIFCTPLFIRFFRYFLLPYTTSIIAWIFLNLFVIGFSSFLSLIIHQIIKISIKEARQSSN